MYLPCPFPPPCRVPLSNICSIRNHCNHGPVVLWGTLPGGCTYIARVVTTASLPTNYLVTTL
nr:MAG TPA: hypothetical protein [Caudoviricetes sp.]